MEDLVSIIVPVYNSEKFIEDTINTVKQQTYKKWELILVNDCSTDNSKKIIKKYVEEDERIKLINLEKNSGAAIARNTGIDNAKGRYIAFLDADDLWNKEKLEKQIKFMKDNDYEFTYTSYEFANEYGIPNGKKVIAKKVLNYKYILKNNIISTITVMFDIEKIDKELIKMPNIQYVEDTATWWKILRNGHTAYGISDLYSYYRRTPKSNSVNKFRTQKFLWRVYRKNENLSFVYSLYCLMFKNLNAIFRRL